MRRKESLIKEANALTLPQAVAATLYGPGNTFLYAGDTPNQQNEAMRRMIERSGMIEVLFAMEALKSQQPQSARNFEEMQQFVSQMSDLSPFRNTTFEEFKESVQIDPASHHIPVKWIAGFLGITEAELLGELQSGRLKATGTPTPGHEEYLAIGIGGPHLVEWLDNMAFDPTGVKFKALAIFKTDTPAN